MSNDKQDTGKPFLRALKLAYKLHKAGLSSAATQSVVTATERWLAQGRDPALLPSAAAPVEDILAFIDTELGFTPVEVELFAAQLGYGVKA